jgi:hypothetical protein
MKPGSLIRVITKVFPPEIIIFADLGQSIPFTGELPAKKGIRDARTLD